MLEESDFQKAIDLLNAGRNKEGYALLFHLYASAINIELKLEVADTLLYALDPARDNAKKIRISTEAINLSGQVANEIRVAYFMAKKAEFLIDRVGRDQYDRANLKLTSGWIEFSTEADKAQDETLAKRMESDEKEIDELLSKANKIIEQRGDKDVLALFYMSKAAVEKGRYFKHKMDHTRNFSKARIARILVDLGFEAPILYGWKYYKTLNNDINEFSGNYLKAAKLFEQNRDTQAAAAYYDLAIGLKSAYRFRAARKYLREAKSIATAAGDQYLLGRIKVVEGSIRTRNRDIPNYVEGESRQKR